MAKIILLQILILFANALYADERCFDTSKRVLITGGISEFNGLIPSPDKTKLLSYDLDGNSLSVYDLKTGDKKVFDRPIGSMVGFNSNNEIAFQIPFFSGESSISSFMSKLPTLESTIIDLSTGRKRTQKGALIDIFSGKVGYRPKVIGDNVVFTNQDKDIFRYHKYFIEGNHDYQITPPEDLSSPDIVTRLGEDQNTIFINSSDGKKIMEISGEHLNEGGSFSTDKKAYFARGHNDNKNFLFFADLITKKGKRIEYPENYSINYDLTGDPIQGDKRTFDPNRKLFLLEPYFGTDKPLATIDPISGEISFLKDIPLSQAAFDRNGNICGFSNNTQSEYKCYDFTTHKEISSSTVGVSPSEYNTTFIGDNKTFILQRSFNIHEREAVIVIPSKTCIDFNNQVGPKPDCQKSPANDHENTPTKDFIKINEKLLCDKDFNEDAWSLKAKDFSDDQSLLWLKKISKPESLNLQEDLLVLNHMITTKTYQKYPNEFSAALVGLSSANISAYEDFARQHPELNDLPPPDENCLTTNEKEKIRPLLENYINYFSFKNGKSVEQYSHLKNTLTLFSEKEKDDLADKLADKILSNAPGQDYEVNGVFSSKLYKFYYNNLKKYFGIPFKDLTDVTFSRTNGKVNAIQLSMNPSEGTTKTNSGLYLKKIEEIDPTQLAPNTAKSISYEWDYSGTSYKSQINIEKTIPKEALVKNSPSPDYQKMGGGKEFNGLIIAGSNLGKDLTDSVVRSYIDYYVKEGFKFAKPLVKDNLEDYLKQRLTGEHPIHYMVKEAHSDGDEKNLFRISSKGKVLTGTRIKNGKKETIEIAYPSDDSKETKMISNDDFGKWMREREKTSNQPLIYLNSSCWSETKAVNEISAASSPLLVNIPTTTSMTVFNNNKDNVMRIVIDGLRNQKTYEDMRKEMVKDSGYASKKGNVFIFPDEDTYKERISNLVLEPVNVDIRISKKLNDNSWKPYSIEEEH